MSSLPCPLPHLPTSAMAALSDIMLESPECESLEYSYGQESASPLHDYTYSPATSGEGDYSYSPASPIPTDYSYSYQPGPGERYSPPSSPPCPGEMPHWVAGAGALLPPYSYPGNTAMYWQNTALQLITMHFNSLVLVSLHIPAQY